MKILIKNLIPKKIKLFIFYLINWPHNIYTLDSFINNQKNSSDFFIWNSTSARIDFIAENVRALLLGKEVPVTHVFKFFSEDGEFIEIQKYTSKNIFERIKIKPIRTKSKYISFTHSIASEHSLEKINSINSKIVKEIGEQNRGYTVYYPEKNIIGNVVHGNFGGISKNKLLAKRSFMHHIYTPIYRFENFHIYDLVFNNPTKNSIKIKVILNNKNKNFLINMPPLGTRFITIKNYYGSISCESRLPICRPLVFKNPAPNSKGDFDVFHS